jgi:hypothetical protein
MGNAMAQLKKASNNKLSFVVGIRQTNMGIEVTIIDLNL